MVAFDACMEGEDWNEDRHMSIALARNRPLMNVRDFLHFLGSRPDEERWELIDGIPMMMAPPKIAHQRIASNLERYLNEALRARKSRRRADREIGLVLQSFGHYRPEPEIAIVDADIDGEERHAGRFYLVAEVISASDDAKLKDSKKSVIEMKLDFYKSHEHCQSVIVVRQDVLNVQLHVRQQDGTWPEQPVTLGSIDDVIEIEAIGRICTLGELYEDTPLAPRPTSPVDQ